LKHGSFDSVFDANSKYEIGFAKNVKFDGGNSKIRAEFFVFSCVLEKIHFLNSEAKFSKTNP
jgi:hypothetical protein